MADMELIRVESDGYLPYVGPVADPVLLRAAAALSVLVVDRETHAPLTGGQVQLLGSESLPEPLVKPGGAFYLSPLEPGHHRLRVSSSAHLPREQAVTLAPGRLTRVSVGLRAGHELTGRVLHEGEPVSGADVTLIPVEETDHGDARMTATSDPDGTFGLGLVPDDFRVTSLLVCRSRSGWLVEPLPGTEEKPLFVHAPRVLELSESFRISGRIELPEGLDETERVRVEARLSLKHRTGRLIRETVDLHVLVPELAPHLRSPVSTAREFALTLPRGSWSLRAISDTGACSDPLTVQLPTAEGGSRLVLALRPGRRIRGRVLNVQGDGIAGARVGARIGRRQGEAVAKTDENGTFALSPVPRGPLRAVVEASGFVTRYLDIAEQQSEVEIELQRNGTLVGCVSLAGGGSVSQFTVEALQQRGGRLRETRSSADSLATQDGGFSLDLAPGTWAVRVRSPSSMATVTQPVVVRSGETTDLGVIELSPGAAIIGTVEVATTLAPLVGATVRILGLEGSATRTDASGEFRLEGVPAGDHTLVASHPAYPPHPSHGQRHVVDASHLPGDRHRFLLHEGGAVRGRVLDSANSPIPGVSVWDERLQDSPATTGNDGTFLLTGLPEGMAILRCHRLPDIAVPVEVQAGVTSQVDLRARTVDLRGRVLRDGVPVRGTLRVVLSDGSVRLTHCDGEYRLESMPPGRWPAQFSSSASTGESVGRQVELRVPADVVEAVQDILLEEPNAERRHVEGDLLASDTEEGLGGWRIIVRTADGVTTSTRTESSGRFTLQLFPGQYELEAFPPTAELLEWEPTRAALSIGTERWTELDVVAHRRARRTVRVLRPDSTPAGGVLAYSCDVTSGRADLGSGRFAGVSDPAGHLELYVQADAPLPVLLLIAPHQGLLVTSMPEEGEGVVVQLPVPGRIIVGGTTATLLARDWQLRVSSESSFRGLTRRVEGDETALEVSGLPPGEYDVMANGHRRSVVLESGSVVELGD